ncbi:MAG: hypothetical protein KY468_12430 [Armatimonadetes bacterium]|nr:hypothetical protein [Armatimonadota bacterium]
MAAVALIAAMMAGCGGGSSGLGSPDTVGNPSGGSGTTGNFNTGGTNGGGSGSTTGAPAPGSGGSGVIGGNPAGKLYRGNATVTVTLFDGNGSESPQTYTWEMLVEVNPPIEHGGFVEENPVNLSLRPHLTDTRSPSGLPPREDGQFTFASAHHVRDRDNRVTSMLQSWKLEMQGNAVSGTLVDNHRVQEEINTVNIPAEITTGIFWPWPSLMGNGSRLSGTLDDGAIRLRIEGRAASRRTSHPFVIELNATRNR